MPRRGGDENAAGYSMIVLLLLFVIFLISNKNENGDHSDAVSKNLCEIQPFYVDEIRTKASNGDGGFKILVANIEDGFKPNKKYDVYLLGQDEGHTFSRFLVSLIPVDSPESEVGSLKPFDEFSKVNEFCSNSVSQVKDESTPEQKFIWTAPHSNECVIITARVYQSDGKWFTNAGELTKKICRSHHLAYAGHQSEESEEYQDYQEYENSEEYIKEGDDLHIQNEHNTVHNEL